MKHLKIRWALHGTEEEPTTRQRGMYVYRELQRLGYDAAAWDEQEQADIIVCQYSLRHQKAALATGAVVVQDINDMIFADHHPYQPSFAEGIRRAHAVVAGTDRLAQHLTRTHPFVRVIPEGVDQDYFEVKPIAHKGLSAVWMGMHDNLVYFSEIDCALDEVAREHRFTATILCPPLDGQKASNEDKVAKKWYPAKFIPWSKDALLQAMSEADFAVVPLFHNEWCYCKAANKALSFMAAGLPVIAADLPPYQGVIQDGHNGYLCLQHKDWVRALTAVTKDAKLRRNIGREGKATAQRFTNERIAEQWLALFEEIRPR